MFGVSLGFRGFGFPSTGCALNPKPCGLEGILGVEALPVLWALGLSVSPLGLKAKLRSFLFLSISQIEMTIIMMTTMVLLIAMAQQMAMMMMMMTALAVVLATYLNPTTQTRNRQAYMAQAAIVRATPQGSIS